MITYRGYILKHNIRSPNLIQVVTEGRGGKIPKVLEGSFTSHGSAKKIIDQYLEKQPTRRSIKNASETNSEGADQ